MSTPAVLHTDIAAGWRGQRGAALTLGIGLIVLGLVFNQEIVAAVKVWIASTAYNHCFLVIPIAAYLVWDRRDTLRGHVAEPWPLVAIAGIPLALAWLLAERLGIMEGRQLVAMSFVELLALAVLGWRLWWQLAGPLLYLYFLVPFGDFITPKLQDFTTGFVRHGLDLLNIPAYIDGYTIEIPEGTFYIAQACAGLRFLIASLAFGALYALLMYRSPLRRSLFLAASLVVPIIANGLRALGIVALGHVLGSAQAAATDHVLYGWIFFSLVILLLILLGLPFREDIIRPDVRTAPPPVARSAATANWQALALAGFLVLIVAAVSPAVALQLDRLGGTAAAPVQALQFGPSCADVPVDKSAAPPAPDDLPGSAATRRVACDGLVYDVTLVVFGTHSTAAPIVAAAYRLGDLPHAPDDEDFIEESYWLAPPAGQPRLWHITHTTAAGPISAVAIWVGGKPATGGMTMRAHLALASLAGASVPPVVLAIRPEVDGPGMTPTLLRTVQPRLSGILQTDFSAQIDRILHQHD